MVRRLFSSSVRIVFFSIGFSIAWKNSLFSENNIDKANRTFMHQPTMMSELYQSNRIITRTKDILGFSQESVYSRTKIEAGEIPIQIFEEPRYTFSELIRTAEDYVIEMKYTTKRDISVKERVKLKEVFIKEHQNKTDDQVIECVALAIANAAPIKIMNLFLRLDHYERYAPSVFKKSLELTLEDLKEKHIVPRKNIKYQFSKIDIASVEFTHTLKYEVSSEKQNQQTEPKEMEGYLVSWEIDSDFKEDKKFPQEGILVNSGRFMIYPYVMSTGTVDESRSLIIYQIYVKIDPLKGLMKHMSLLVKDSSARSTLKELASAMQQECLK